MPQLMKQAGMKAIYFGRGVKPAGVANKVFDFKAYSSQFSEMYWKSPDGSTLPAILFANWYDNGGEIPEDAAPAYWDKKLLDVLKYAGTDELLMMNGSDHQPVQKNIGKAIIAANEKYSEYNFIHSNYEKYAESVIAKLPKNATVIEGELISQDTNGYGTLVNTCSSHSFLKRMNRQCEIMLESVAEPLAVLAAETGCEYPHDILSYSWKTLMKNHTHDCICGCSVDAVHKEMEIRFDKSRQAAETVVSSSLMHISKHIDTTKFADCKAVFAIINTYSKKKNSVVSVDVDFNRFYGSAHLRDSAKYINNSDKTDKYVLLDDCGNIIPYSIVFNKARFGYDLPDDKFRQPYMAESGTVTFEATDVPAMGYRLYGIKVCDENTESFSLVSGKNTMENDALLININDNGTFNMTNKETGTVYKNILSYEDVGDIGNEYNFVASTDGEVYTASDVKIELVIDESYMAQYKITSVMTIPESADDKHIQEIMEFVEYDSRTGGRSENFIDIVVNTFLTLEKHSKSVKIKTEFENTAKDHRLRVIIPTGLNCDTHRAESVFEAALRPNRHKECWQNPSGCEHQQGFVMMDNGIEGIIVANIGMYEYEILKNNEIAITLVRAVSDLGDWGVFPTQLSQCLRKLDFEYEIAPYVDENTAFDIAAALQYPLLSTQVFDTAESKLENGNIFWNGDMLRMTACKKKQDNDDIILRFVNYSKNEQYLNIKKSKFIDNLYKSNIVEIKGEHIEEQNGGWRILTKPYEIITLGVRKNRRNIL